MRGLILFVLFIGSMALIEVSSAASQKGDTAQPISQKKYTYE